MEKGNYIHCHTTGYFRNTSDVFAKAGKDYLVTSYSKFNNRITILNEKGNKNHIWFLDDELFDMYFIKNMVRKNIKKLKFI
jgi:hypothetical protein